VITTARSVVVGLAAWLLAFAVAYAGRINPIHLNGRNLSILVLSAFAGSFTVTALGKKYCRHGYERGSAVMIFATCWFVGIYVPIAAIWANAPLYAWAASQKAKPRFVELVAMLVPAVERMALSIYSGVGALFATGYLVTRRVKVTVPDKAKTGSMLGWNLDKVDVLFGVLAFTMGLFLVQVSRTLRLTELVQWLGCSGAAFLLCFLFRSLRLQRNALEKQMLEADGPPIAKKGGTLCVVTLLLCCGSMMLQVQLYNLLGFWVFPLYAIILLIPWLLFRRVVGRCTTVTADRAQLLGQFTVRCGFWSGLAWSLTIGGWVFPSIAENELAKGGGISTPFAYTVLAMKPLFCISALPGGFGAWIGAFALTLAFPRSTRASERILACAQGGAVMLVINCICLVLFVASLAWLTVASIPSQGAPQLSEFSHRFVSGNWISLGCLYMGLLALSAAAGAASWALGATVGCGLIWLRERLRRA